MYGPSDQPVLTSSEKRVVHHNNSSRGALCETGEINSTFKVV